MTAFLTIVIEPTGDLLAIHDDRLDVLIDQGRAITYRASHVEPAPCGGWTADLGPVGGPILDAGGVPFRLRGEALAAERAYLEHLLRSGELGDLAGP